MSEELSPRRRRHRVVVGWLTTFASLVARHTPLRWLHRLGDALGSLACVLGRRRQRRAYRDLELCFGDRLTPAERRRILNFSARNAAKTILEMLRVPAMSEAELRWLVGFENPEVLEELVRLGTGGVLVTTHSGNWNLWGIAAGRHVPELVTVANDLADSKAMALFRDAGRSGGLTVLGRSQVREMLRTVRAGGFLAMAPDQRAGGEGAAQVDFMGRPARTYTGTAALALRAGVPILPGFARRTEDDRIVCHFGEPFEVPDTGDRKADVLRGTQMVNDVFGREIMQHPAQWLWLHNRWRPGDEEPQAGATDGDGDDGSGEA